MTRDLLPSWHRGAGSLYCCIDVSGASLRDVGDLFTGGRIGCLEIFSFGRWLELSVDEVAEAALVMIEPQQGFFGILGSWAVFHRGEFFDDAHRMNFPR